MKSRVFKVLTILMLLSMLIVPLGGQPAKAISQVMEVTPVSQKVGVSENGIYIVRLADASLAAYQGGIAGLKATSPEATGARRLDTSTPESIAYLNYLGIRQGALLDNMAKAFGHPIEVVYQYKNVLNAVAVRLDHPEALKAFSLPEVKAVYPDQARHYDTNIGPTLIGAPAIWEGDDIATQGEGIIIGLIDSGINHAHPSFADLGGDGYDHDNPYGAGNYVGYCVDNPDFCNDKLIGAYDLLDIGSPEDLDGHGSHTASTAGGNYVDIEITDSTGTYVVTISGVAPHANLIAYRVCYNNSCWPSASIAAVDLAIGDQVDVLNYSISGGDDPWNDAVDLAFLEANAAGIFVSASAGNAGPDASTVAKTGPWNASVAATTIGRLTNIDFVTDAGSLMDIAALQGTGPALLDDLSAPILYGGDIDATNIIGCNPWPEDAFLGMIGLVQRGTCAFTIKVDNLAAAGAVGAVVFDNTIEELLTMGGLDTTTIPAMFISMNDGLDVVDLISLDATAEATMQPGTNSVDPAQADIVAGFSSRGPSQWDLLKPDYAAPGVNVLAAVAAKGDDPLQFNFYSGTSMAAPHGAGSAALLMALHPDWSPAEVKSVLATTANQEVRDSDGVTPADPFDDGSGRIDLAAAAYAGFAMDETYDNYVAANPYLGGQPRDLNQPSMVDLTCIGVCSWTRTITSTSDDAQDWEISFDAPAELILSATPMTFTLEADATQEILITADVSTGVLDQYYFGDVILTPADEDLSVAHLPVVVQITQSSLPDLVDIVTNVTPGSFTLNDLQSFTEVSELTSSSFGLFRGTQHDLLLAEDPTNDDPFDDLAQVFWIEVNISFGASRLVAEIVDSEAPDVDLFVGSSSPPSADTILCTSATGTWAEYCNIDDPGNGRYWVLVQNWSGSSTQPDRIKLIITVVDDTDAGNMTISGPTSIPATEPFDLDINWDEPEMLEEPGLEPLQYWYGRFYLGTDPSHPENLGYANVNLDFMGDVYAVELTPPSQVGYGDPAEIVPYTLTVENLGNVDDSYNLTPSGNTWDVSLPVTNVFVPQGESRDFLAYVTVSPDALADDSDTVTITAQSANKGSVLDTATVTTYANAVFDIDLAPATALDLGAPGDVVSYDLTLSNLGNADDTVTLAATGNVWDVTLPPIPSYNLSAGETVTVTVDVTIPLDAETGEYDVVTVTATSDGGDEASSVLTTTAYAIDNDIALLPPVAADLGEPGDVIQYTLTLINLANTTDSVTLTASGNVWDVSLPTSPIDLLPAESVEVIVEVTIPADALDGDADVVTITATSLGGDLATSVLTTTVDYPYDYYLPLVFKTLTH